MNINKWRHALDAENYKMNESVKKEWLIALTSGDYKQHDGIFMRSIHGFNAFGVLMDIYLKSKNSDWVLLADGVYEFEWEAIVKNENPVETVLKYSGLSMCHFKKICTMNAEKTFDAIAMYIFMKF